MSSRTTEPAIDPAAVTVVPANEASRADLRAVFGTADYSGRCNCQRFKVRGWLWTELTDEQRRDRLYQQTRCGEPGAGSTSGLVGYLDGEPVGWVAVQPRTAYPKLATGRIVWRGRAEDKQDDTVWAVTCFVVRKGFRKRGLTYPLAAATVGYARGQGARAVEGYPMRTEPGKETTWGELHVGSVQVFAEAGFREVSTPSLRRVVMRVDFP
jgi:GNAT superfamily N-acetyltransferase